ncbi:hypothetical protein [Galbibacter sp. BG1]
MKDTLMVELSKKVMVSVTQEEAEAKVDQLTNLHKTDGGGVIVYSGEHSEDGYIFVVIPAFGNSILLYPFEGQKLNQ